MKILVIGASGNIGSLLVPQLAAQGIVVRAAARNVEKLRQKHGGADAVPFDFGDAATWPAALARVAKVFFVAPPSSTVTTHLEAFLAAAKRAGVRHLVFSSGRTTGDIPGSALYVTEGLVRQSGVGWTILRPGWFMQNFLHWVGFTIPAGDAFYLPAANSKTAFIDVRDIAAVAAKVLTSPRHESKIYELVSSEAITHTRVAEHISKAVGRRIKYVPLNDDDFVKEMMKRGWSQSAAENTVALYKIVKTGKEEGISGDVELVLGRPSISFGQFAMDHAGVWAG
ncbi:MAG: SDR family oxidoreductase [Saprospiraceae bacterium]